MSHVKRNSFGDIDAAGVKMQCISGLKRIFCLRIKRRKDIHYLAFACQFIFLSLGALGYMNVKYEL